MSDTFFNDLSNCVAVTPPTLPQQTYYYEKEKITKEINKANNTTLGVDDLIFSTPIKLINNPNYNTSVRVSASLDSKFTGTTYFKYNRTDVSKVFTNTSLSVTPTTQVFLSDLMPLINTTFGTNLQIGDYIDVILPVFNPATPLLPLSVEIVADDDSYAYFGSYNLQLGPRASQIANANVTRKYFIARDTDASVAYNQTIVNIDDGGNVISNFVYFNFATTLNTSTISNIYPASNGGVIANGLFGFTGPIGSAAIGSHIVPSVELDGMGRVAFTSNTNAFGNTPDSQLARNKNQSFVYATDPINKVVQYDMHGVLQTSFVASAIAYVPVLVAQDNSGNIYTVSPVYYAPVGLNSGISSNQYRIDRMLNTGALDTTFTPVIITAIGTSMPIALTQLVVNNSVTAGGFFCVFNNLNGCSNLVNQPLINEQSPIVIPSLTDHAVNLVYKFDNFGNWDRTFVNDLPNFASIAIYNPNVQIGSSVEINSGDSILTVNKDTAVLFTNKANPITGIIHRQPMSFDYTGNPINTSGDAYQDSYRWYDATQMLGLSDGSVVAYGHAMLPLVQGGWSIQIPILAKYDYNSIPLQILYSTSAPAPTPPPVIRQVVVSETTI